MRKIAGYELVIHARGTEVAAKVGSRVATVAVLPLQFGVRARTHVRVANEHTETLEYIV